MELKKARASIIEMFSRVISVNTNDKVYTNDSDNLYPNRIEALINNSPTAFRCAKLMSAYISGQGIENPAQDIIINKAKNYKISDLISIASDSVSYHYGIYFHVFYGIDFKINKIDVLPNTKVRHSKEDANENKGKFYFKDWDKKNIFGAKEKPLWFYPFNQNKDVILSQMKNDNPKAETNEELVKTFRGQVYYLNLTPQFQYSMSLVDSVYNDADTENRLSMYVNKQMRTGFLDQTIILKNDIDKETDLEIEEKLKALMGSENAGNLMMLSVPQQVNVNLNELLVIKQIPSSFKPELLEKIGSRLKTNIMGAFNNIPWEFVSSGTGAWFGTNGDTYSQMKDFYSEQTAYERKSIEKTLKMFGFDVAIKPITGVKISSFDENNAIKLKSQAELKGSVGGVTSLITLVQSVSSGSLDLNSAIEIVKEIYGLDEITARKMLGTPNIIPTTNG